MLAGDSFQFGKAKFHGNDDGVKGISKCVRFPGLAPIGKVGIGGGGVLDHEVLDMILKVGGPGEDAFHAGGVGSDDTDGSEGQAQCREVFLHELKPLMGDVSGSAAHVGENRVSLTVREDAEEYVESCVRVDFDLLSVWKVVLKGTDSFIFRIEVKGNEGNLLGLIPVGNTEADGGFADAPFPSFCKNDAFVGTVAICVR